MLVQAVGLGKLSTEVSDIDCSKKLAEADKRNVKNKMKACVNSVSTELDLDAQRMHRLACKTNASQALATLRGVDPTQISTEQTQEFLQAAAQGGVAASMEACVDAVDPSSSVAEQEAALVDCRTSSAKQAVAQAYGELVGDISDEVVEEVVIKGTRDASRQAAKACIEVPTLHVLALSAALFHV